MWPIIIGVMRTYAPYVLLPVSATIGFLGYMYESNFRDIHNPYKSTTIQEERDQRKLEEMKKEEDLTDITSLKSKPGVPKTILDRNNLDRITKEKTKQANS